MKKLTGFIMLFSLLTLLFIVSCSKKTSKVASKAKTNTTIAQQKFSENNPTKTEKQEQQPERLKKNVIVLGEKKNTKRKEVSSRNPEYISGGSNFLKDRSGDFITPQDFKIGILQREFAIDNTTNEQYTVIKKFLESLKHGTINKRVIEPEEAENIVKLLGYHLKTGQIPLAYRIGQVITTKNKIITANIRLIGKNNSTEGQIYLTHKDKNWFVQNIQIDLSLLTRKATGSKRQNSIKQPFNPSTFEWILKNNE